jgi:acetyl esterase/lipase
MSLRAELVRLGVRWLVKRTSRDAIVEQMRRRCLASEAFIPKPPAGTRTEAIDLGGIKAERVTTPVSQHDRNVLYLHGGGYASGSFVCYRHLTWRIASATRASVLIIDYRLAPEHPFPAAVDDAVSAYRWLLAAGAEPGQLAIVGDSAGGGLALATVLMSRDERLPLPAAVVALSPWTDLALTGDSLRRHARSDPMIDNENVATLAAYYLAGADPRMPYASPLYADAAAFPPTLIQVGSDEVLLDDAVRMADRLRVAGCEVELEVWPRMPHVWHLFVPLVPEASRAIERIGRFVEGKL